MRYSDAEANGRQVTTGHCGDAVAMKPSAHPAMESVKA
jgi:hypothetical protein